MVVLRGMFLVWLLLAAAVEINLYPVRNSGIFTGTAGLTVIYVLTALVVAVRPSLVYWRSRLTVPLLALATTAVIAGVQGALLYDPSVAGEHRYVLVQIYAVGLTLLSLGMPVLVSILLPQRRHLQWLLWILVAASLALLANSVFRLRLPAPYWWPMMSAQAISLIAAWLLFEKHERWTDYLAGGLFVAVMLFDVLIFPLVGDVPVQWLSGWIAISTPIALLIVIRFPRQSLRLGIPLAIVAAILLSGKIERAYEMAYREGDFGRLRLWEDALKMVALRPLFGVGPGNYLDYVMRYGDFAWSLSSPHGNYQQIAAEMGVVGLGFTAWLLYRMLALGAQVFRSSRERLVRALAIGAACGIAGQAAAGFVGDFVLPSYHNGGAALIGATIYIWVSAGILICLERIEAEKAATGTGAAGAESRSG